MGFAEKGLAKAYQRQKQALVKEIATAGLSLEATEEINLVENSAKSSVFNSIKGLTGGKLQPDCFQIYTIRTDSSTQCYIQPFAGPTPLPGEHHINLPGSFSQPLALTDTAIFGGPVWESPDQSLAQQLNKERPELKKAVKKCEFSWPVGTGKIELKWAAQLFSLGDGSSRFVLKAGRYGGFTTYQVGFAHFSALTALIQRELPQQAAPVQGALYPVSLQAVADPILNSGTLPQFKEPAKTDDPAGPEKSDNLAETIRQAVAPWLGKKVFNNEIPAKKEQNMRKHILPPDNRDAQIIAAFDTTVMGSAKDGLVFTATHCYSKEIDETVTIPLSEITAMNGLRGSLDDKVELELNRSTTILIPVGNHEESLPALFKAIADA